MYFIIRELLGFPEIRCYLKVTKFSDTLNLAILCLTELAHT